MGTRMMMMTDMSKPRARSSPLILRSQPKAGVSKHEGALAPSGGTSAALYRLMAWLSPAFPVGAFSYSGGLEWAVEAGDITDARTLQGWLTVVVAEGGGFCDAVLFTNAHRAAATGDDLLLRETAELADLTIYVIDVAAGDKIPSKGGPGITRSDLLVINKIDLAPHVGASLEVMERDSKRMRGARPFVFANLRIGQGVDEIVRFIQEKGGL